MANAPVALWLPSPWPQKPDCTERSLRQCRSSAWPLAAGVAEPVFESGEETHGWVSAVMPSLAGPMEIFVSLQMFQTRTLNLSRKTSLSDICLTATQMCCVYNPDMTKIWPQYAIWAQNNMQALTLVRMGNHGSQSQPRRLTSWGDRCGSSYAASLSSCFFTCWQTHTLIQIKWSAANIMLQLEGLLQTWAGTFEHTNATSLRSASFINVQVFLIQRASRAFQHACGPENQSFINVNDVLVQEHQTFQASDNLKHETLAWTHNSGVMQYTLDFNNSVLPSLPSHLDLVIPVCDLLLQVALLIHILNRTCTLLPHQHTHSDVQHSVIGGGISFPVYRWRESVVALPYIITRMHKVGFVNSDLYTQEHANLKMYVEKKVVDGVVGSCQSTVSCRITTFVTSAKSAPLLCIMLPRRLQYASGQCNTSS